MNKQERIDNLCPVIDGIRTPKYIRCYDGESFNDRYTVVFTKTGYFEPKMRGGCFYLGMSADPFHPQGVGQHGESRTMIDRPAYSHLGKKIKFADLPSKCQKLVMQDYKAYWDLDIDLNTLITP